MARIQAGDDVLLWTPNGHRRIVRIETGTVRVPGLGVLKMDEFLQRSWGDKLRLGGEEFILLRPRLADRLQAVERGAQIVLAKDASRIVLECGLHAGSRVAEAGVGSGALTTVLAHAIAPTGRVYAFDVREDHLKQGRRNLENAGLAPFVEFSLGDIATELTEDGLDAVVLDLPEPDQVVETAWKRLASSGVVAAYVPLVSQVEKATRALREQGFLEVRAMEIIERPWVVGERGSRPETTMLAHTGFLVFARRP